MCFKCVCSSPSRFVGVTASFPGKSSISLEDYRIGITQCLAAESDYVVILGLGELGYSWTHEFGCPTPQLDFSNFNTRFGLSRISHCYQAGFWMPFGSLGQSVCDLILWAFVFIQTAKLSLSQLSNWDVLV